MNLFAMFDVSGSALTAERERAEVVASNMANADTTRTAKGGPYQRQEVIFGSTPVGGSSFAERLASAADGNVQGVQVVKVVGDPTAPIRRFDPSHPDADAQGYVSYPAINPVQEMVDLMGASRSYQLNVSALQSTKEMIQQSLEILT
ncbi:MAG TPA: flagellar basal body rod protein FlgC [Terriglobia bacterium]|nr:flagellar basal body rod protein FlgC [Terriglobia bacterium]